jgi:hypothetical protein
LEEHLRCLSHEIITKDVELDATDFQTYDVVKPGPYVMIASKDRSTFRGMPGGISRELVAIRHQLRKKTSSILLSGNAAGYERDSIPPGETGGRAASRSFPYPVRRTRSNAYLFRAFIAHSG